MLIEFDEFIDVTPEPEEKTETLLESATKLARSTTFKALNIKRN